MAKKPPRQFNVVKDGGQNRELRRDAMQMAVDWYTRLGHSASEDSLLKLAARISTFIFRGFDGEDDADGKPPF